MLSFAALRAASRARAVAPVRRSVHESTAVRNGFQPEGPVGGSGGSGGSGRPRLTDSLKSFLADHPEAAFGGALAGGIFLFREIRETRKELSHEIRESRKELSTRMNNLTHFLARGGHARDSKAAPDGGSGGDVAT